MIPVTGLLQAAQSSGPGLGVFALQIGAFIAIFWFLLIRPQRKEQQKHQEMIQALVKGDEVITNGGIIGKITRAEPTRLTLRTGGVDVIVDRGRIAQKVSPETDSE
ncbi:MAG TPA: preprotein translocase subunit YajC [Longimicrobiales bacterium]|nr:preprotein translocase subunit YajC [Longimicrobiales bacterium]